MLLNLLPEEVTGELFASKLASCCTKEDLN